MFQTRCKQYTWHVCDFIRKHGGFNNWYILRLASKPCTTSLEARIELRKHFDATPPTLNKHLPTRTRKEYSKGEKTKARQKEYRGENREKIIQDQAAIYQRNKEKIAIKRRAYFLANRDKCNALARAYRARLKEAVLVEAARRGNQQQQQPPQPLRQLTRDVRRPARTHPNPYSYYILSISPLVYCLAS